MGKFIHASIGVFLGWILACIIFWAAGYGAAHGAEYKFTDVVNATTNSFTLTTGINDRGDIVGWYAEFGAWPQGFLFHDGVMTPLDIVPNGINRDGIIIGRSFYGDAAIWENGITTLVNVPGANYTNIESINDKGEISGWYIKTDIGYFGFQGTPIRVVKK